MCRMKSLSQCIRYAGRAPAREGGDEDHRGGDRLLPARDALIHQKRSATRLDGTGRDDEDIVHPRGPEIVDREAPDGKGHSPAARMQIRLSDAGEAQEIGSAPLEKAEIAGMIDGPGK
jgi:hypothetical protein